MQHKVSNVERFKNPKLLLGSVAEAFSMNSREFVEKYKDSIICEPSGRTLSELERENVVKMRLL